MTTAPGSITDVTGVAVGHLTRARDAVQTGVTVIVPYPPAVTRRSLFIGGFARGGDHEWTGLHVAQDFGMFSAPIALVNATTIGIAYDALITRAHQRDDELPSDMGWPPIVIGIDDGYLNDLRRREVGHDDVLRAIADAGSRRSVGSVGIGRGLCAFGGKGGVGEASRRFAVAGRQFTIGALVAAGGGRILESADPNGDAAGPDAGVIARSVRPAMIAILATDLPLVANQLRRVAEAGAIGLGGLVARDGSDHQLALAFSTGNPTDGAFEPGFRLHRYQLASEAHIRAACAAASACTRAAVRSALEAAEPVTGRAGRAVVPLPRDRIAALFGPAPG